MKLKFKNIIGRVERFINKSGTSKKCNVCGHTFRAFTKFRGGSKNTPDFLKRLQMVGSDPDNFKCIYCRSTDRERHLIMYFDKLNLWDKVSSYSILHFAPEPNLALKLRKMAPLKYIQADLNPQSEGISKVDATAIPYEEGSFDLIICNHVLEHIPDYRKALAEIYRSLKPNGVAILQTPFSKFLKHNFQDANIISETDRDYFYGQSDHVRVFGEHSFFNDLVEVGFKLEIVRNKDFFDSATCKYFGINEAEDLIRVVKPSHKKI